MAPTLYDFHHLPHVKTQHESKKALWVTLLLTMFFTAVEIIGGLISNSLALLSDSAHMASDVLALGLSMVALYMATRPPNRRFTFGFLRFEIITSFLNGLTLAVIALWILWEGIQRFLHPEPINFRLMLGIAAIGLVVNLILTIVLSRSTKEEDNLNVQSALWHFIGDLISSIGVIVSALLIYFTGWTMFDPIISFVIAAIIFTGGAKIMRESYLILMESRARWVRPRTNPRRHSKDRRGRRRARHALMGHLDRPLLAVGSCVCQRTHPAAVRHLGGE